MAHLELRNSNMEKELQATKKQLRWGIFVVVVVFVFIENPSSMASLVRESSREGTRMIIGMTCLCTMERKK